MELIAQMAGLPQAGMDTGPLSRLEGFCGHFDILVDRTGETPYRAPVARDLANLLHRAKIAGARDGKARLDHIDVHAHQLTCDNDFPSVFMLTPGGCSPSRSVVSKIAILRLMISS